MTDKDKQIAFKGEIEDALDYCLFCKEYDLIYHYLFGITKANAGY